ncbi:MAG: hypothetical protein V1929_07960 [bacterium]
MIRYKPGGAGLPAFGGAGFMPEFVLQPLKHMEDDGANGTVLDRLNQTKHELVSLSCKFLNAFGIGFQFHCFPAERPRSGAARSDIPSNAWSCISFFFFPDHLNISIPLDSARQNESAVVGIVMSLELPHFADQSFAVR